MIVIDVSAIIPYILYKDREVEQAILESDRIISPELYVPECGNTLLQYVKNNIITLAESQNYLEQCLNATDHLINLNANAKTIMVLAYENQLSFYDAQYLFLSLASRAKLLSRDKKLNKIAEKYEIKY